MRVNRDCASRSSSSPPSQSPSPRPPPPHPPASEPVGNMPSCRIWLNSATASISWSLMRSSSSRRPYDPFCPSSSDRLDALDSPKLPNVRVITSSKLALGRSSCHRAHRSSR